MKLVAFRIPTILDERFEKALLFSHQQKSEVIRSLIEGWAEKHGFEGAIGLAKQVEIIEDEVREVESDETFKDDQKRLETVNVKVTGSFGDKLQWLNKDGEIVSRENAVRGFADTTLGRVRFTVEEYEAWVKDKVALARVVERYKAQVKALQDKIESLKAEIVYTSPS